MKKLNFLSSANKMLAIFWLIVISLSIIGVVFAAAPNPGHNFTESSGGIVQGDLIYGSAADTFSALAKSITATRYISNTGVSNNPAWAQIDLTNGVTGALPIANGGTNITTYATGDILYGSALNVLSKLAGAAGFLKSTGAAAPAWSTINLATSADVGTSILPVANGGTGVAAAASDAVLVGDSTSAYTARTLPASCAGTTAKLLYDSTTNLFSCGTDQTSTGTATQYNQSVTTPAAGFAADTYLVGSSIAIPANSLKVGTRYHLIFNVSKTAAGTATPILNVRFGTLGTTGDSAKCTLTWTAQTAATDTGTFEVWTTFRTVGSGTTAVLQCVGQRRHGASITGLGTLVSETKAATSAGFDSTVANSIIGTSVNGGTSAAWTITLVQAELSNLQ